MQSADAVLASEWCRSFRSQQNSLGMLRDVLLKERASDRLVLLKAAASAGEGRKGGKRTGAELLSLFRRVSLQTIIAIKVSRFLRMGLDGAWG